MIYGIKATVENLHSKHISKALKEQNIPFVFVSVGEEPAAKCDQFLDPKDDSSFIYVKTENEIDVNQLKDIATNAMLNYSASDYYPEMELQLESA